jgi:hypothetical protein
MNNHGKTWKNPCQQHSKASVVPSKTDENRIFLLKINYLTLNHQLSPLINPT